MEFQLDNKLFEAGCVTIDGRLDEPVWQEAKSFGNFLTPESKGGELAERQTEFKILPCADRLYIGIRCEEPDIDYVMSTCANRSCFASDSTEVFLAPTGTPFSFYQYFITVDNKVFPFYYEESGVTRPDPYAPTFKSATYAGEDYWSVEIELPFTALYMTSNNVWQDTWMINVTRTRNRKNGVYTAGGQELSSWSKMVTGFFDPDRFNKMSGFPIRAAEDDVYVATAMADMTEICVDGYKGNMKVTANCAVGGEFIFTSENSEPFDVTLTAGGNEFFVPCVFDEINRKKISMGLTRKSSGKVFARTYPVMVTYEPIKIRFTLPEYRNNFYPGQDYTKIVGAAKAEKPITLTLEGPGIPKQTVIPNADGSFVFETPNFEEGDAYLIATIDGFEIKKKISRLAPTGHMMSWISGGNLIVDGKAVLRRNIYADRWRGGEVYRRKYDTEPQYQTPQITRQKGYMVADALVKNIDTLSGESSKDIMPCDELFRKMDEVMENNKDNDFTYWYISDEPECRQVSPIYLRHIYEYIAERDPYHVCLIASRNADIYVDCADWFETHAYVGAFVNKDGTRGYQRPINTLGRYVDDIAKFNRPDKCIGFFPTAFAYKYLTRSMDYLTFDEMICHTWAAMIRGGKSLWPFAFMDLPDRAAMYYGLRYVFASFEALEEFVLHAKRTTLINTPEVEAVHYNLPDKKMFVLINKVETPQTVTLDTITGTWCEFRHARDIATNTFDLAPFETVIGTSEDFSGDLPTYQEIKAICDNHDYKRTHSKSLLYERYDDMVVTTSANARGNYKMFDGVLDDMGWEDYSKVEGREKFIQLDMSKFHPTFDKIRLCGWNVDGTTVKYGDQETALADLKMTEVETSEFSHTYVLSRPITADILRFNFHNEMVEVFEIEIFAPQ